MTGSLIFSIVETKSDIAFATAVASCFSKNPLYKTTKTVKTILKYLKGLKQQKITYKGKEELKIQDYSDLDCVEDRKSRNSTSRYILMLNKTRELVFKETIYCCIVINKSQIYYLNISSQRSNLAISIADKT